MERGGGRGGERERHGEGGGERERERGRGREGERIKHSPVKQSFLQSHKISSLFYRSEVYRSQVITLCFNRVVVRSHHSTEEVEVVGQHIFKVVSYKHSPHVQLDLGGPL